MLSGKLNDREKMHKSLGVDYKVCPFFVFFFSVKPLMTRDWEKEKSKELIVRIG